MTESLRHIENEQPKKKGLFARVKDRLSSVADAFSGRNTPYTFEERQAIRATAEGAETTLLGKAGEAFDVFNHRADAAFTSTVNAITGTVEQAPQTLATVKEALLGVFNRFTSPDGTIKRMERTIAQKEEMLEVLEGQRSNAAGELQHNIDAVESNARSIRPESDVDYATVDGRRAGAKIDELDVEIAGYMSTINDLRARILDIQRRRAAAAA